MAHERKCFCCGASYKFCGQGCRDEHPNETWRFLFDNENCKSVYEIWQSVRGNEISKSDAAKIFRTMNIDKVLAADTIVSKDIKQILDENKEHYNKPEKVVTEEVKPEEKSEEIKDKTPAKVPAKSIKNTKK